MPFFHCLAEKVLLIWGGFLIVGAAVVAGFEVGGRISRQSILVIAVGSVAGSGVALSGLRAHRSASGKWGKLPAFTLIGIGGILAVGSPVVFHPWSYDGLAAGIAGMFTAMVFVLGIGCLLIGGYCAIREVSRPALVTTTVVAGLGWEYVF